MYQNRTEPLFIVPSKQPRHDVIQVIHDKTKNWMIQIFYIFTKIIKKQLSICSITSAVVIMTGSQT